MFRCLTPFEISLSWFFMHFEDLAVNNYLFLKYVCICLWKILNLSTLDQCKVFCFSLIFWRLSVEVCEKGHFFPFLHTVTHWSKVLNGTIGDFSQMHAHIFEQERTHPLRCNIITRSQYMLYFILYTLYSILYTPFLHLH